MIEQDKAIIEHQFTKSEIATYLKDFHETTMLAMKCPDEPFYEVFKKAVKYDNTTDFNIRDYYIEMLFIYKFQVLSKYFTTFYDNNFSLLLEDRVENMKILDEIFVNQSFRKKFKAKRIINLIRIAFNHNNNPDHALLKFLRINKNGEKNIYAEILLKKVEPVPFNVILNLDDFSEIISGFKAAINLNLLALRRGDPISSNDIDVILNKLYVRKFFFLDKNPKEKQLEELYNHFSKMRKRKGQMIDLNATSEEEYRVALEKEQEEYEELLRKNGLEFKDYSLSDSQKKKIKEELKNCPIEGNNILFHLVSNVMPLPALKIRTLILNLCLIAFFYNNYSLNQIREEAEKIFKGNLSPDNSLLFTYINYFGVNRNFLYDVFDFKNSFSLASAIYYGYLFDTMIDKEEKTEITPGNKIQQNKIRDSFVHMRWHRGVNGSWELFDWKNENEIKGDFSEGFLGSISKEEMEECSKRIYKEKVGPKDTPIQLVFKKLDDGKFTLDSIYCVKDLKLYFLLASEMKLILPLKVMERFQLPKDATKEEQEIFINELNDFHNTIIEKYKPFVKEIIDALQLTTSNIEPDVDIEKEKCKRKNL